MAICTRCGAVTNDQDMDHVCDPADVPEKGKKHQPHYDKMDK